MAKTRDALKIIDQMIGSDAELRQLISEERVNAAVAQMIYEARTSAGLTQKELAERLVTLAAAAGLGTFFWRIQRDKRRAAVTSRAELLEQVQAITRPGAAS